MEEIIITKDMISYILIGLAILFFGIGIGKDVYGK
tara:strand:+ start:54 stop:158 length:105 start_codon:yes stop_codon:yes gene_type:complete